jgi:holin-like protein
MLQAMFAILAFQFLGGLAVMVLGINFPGPLCGMLLLLIYLSVAGNRWTELDKAASTLVDHLGLLFVPAGVAIISFGEEISSNWLPIAAAIFISTALAIAAAGVIANRTAPDHPTARLETASPRLEHFPVKWPAVDVAKMRPNKEIELGSDLLATEKAQNTNDQR